MDITKLDKANELVKKMNICDSYITILVQAKNNNETAKELYQKDMITLNLSLCKSVSSVRDLVIKVYESRVFIDGVKIKPSDIMLDNDILSLLIDYYTNKRIAIALKLAAL